MVLVIAKELVYVIKNVLVKVLELLDYHPELINAQECAINLAVAVDLKNAIRSVHAKVMER